MSPALSVAAVGDIQLGDSAACTGFGFASRYPGADLASVFKDVQRDLKADLVIGNLETMLSRIGLVPHRWASLQMRGWPQYADSLRQAGFTVINVANNHALQHGLAAFDETVAVLRDASIEVCGLRGRRPWSSAPVVVSIRNELRVGCLGYSLRPRQFSVQDPPYAEGVPEAMFEDIKRLSHEVDFVVVSLHWGEEFVQDPSSAEVTLGRSMIDAGAHAILGHHPHVLRPVETYRGRAIAYSLGNFATDMLWDDRLRHGAILKIRFGSEGTAAVEAQPTEVDTDYTIKRCRLPDVEIIVESVRGLPKESYHAATWRSLKEIRRAKRAYAARNWFRYRPRLLVQLALHTLRNRIFTSSQ
jgi:gamma-polyglutamate biosynthesis protein CapA